MSDYSGESCDLEVARYGLRTFRPMQPGSSGARFMNMRSTVHGTIVSWAFPPETVDQNTVLGSVYISGQHWPDGTCKAECHADDGVNNWISIGITYPTVLDEHLAPQNGCHCGIYATHTLDHLVDQYSNYARDIVTVIAAEGQTIMGDKGFRTQFARVVAYWCADNLLGPCQKQFKDAQRYGEVNDMLKAYDFPYVEKPVGVLQKIEHAMVNMFGPNSLRAAG